MCKKEKKNSVNNMINYYYIREMKSEHVCKHFFFLYYCEKIRNIYYMY